MALELKPTSGWWYARYSHKGRLYRVNLNVRVAGRRPARITQEGDAAFERSRGQAMREHDRLLEEIERKHNEEEIRQRLLEIKMGERHLGVPLSAMAEAWGKIPRKREPDATYAVQCRRRLERFAAFIRERHPKVVTMDMVTAEIVKEFLDVEHARGVSAKTWNDVLKLLRGTFKHLQPEAHGYRRFLLNCPTKETETIFRKPFTPEELKAILEAARDDDFIRPIIVTAMCTAMRRGDCCLLRWEDVDLERRFIRVKTAKTGATVDIPIFPLLFEELAKLERDGRAEVFPEQSLIYRARPDYITSQVRRVLAMAGFVDSAKDLATAAADGVARPPADMGRAMDAIAEANMTSAKRARMRQIAELYFAGRTLPAIAGYLNVSKGTVSGHLNELEALAGGSILRRRGAAAAEGIVRGAVRVDRAHGMRRGSVRDFHSFRVTWVTLALTAGVPMELVTKVTGHKTVDIVLRHYFQPGREAFRRALENAMPKLLTDVDRDPRQRIREIVESPNPATWERDAGEVLRLLQQVGTLE